MERSGALLLLRSSARPGGARSRGGDLETRGQLTTYADSEGRRVAVICWWRGWHGHSPGAALQVWLEHGAPPGHAGGVPLRGRERRRPRTTTEGSTGYRLIGVTSKGRALMWYQAQPDPFQDTAAGLPPNCSRSRMIGEAHRGRPEAAAVRPSQPRTRGRRCLRLPRPRSATSILLPRSSPLAGQMEAQADRVDAAAEQQAGEMGSRRRSRWSRKPPARRPSPQSAGRRPQQVVRAAEREPHPFTARIPSGSPMRACRLA